MKIDADDAMPTGYSSDFRSRERPLLAEWQTVRERVSRINIAVRARAHK